ncbi:hypothetical protein [Streptomyces sp. NPDC007856]|uniref:hypothetical protein n=1 Tax=Streptomyces sp. NPDC007856 TaxID=3364781 RepID=UPI0036B49434
MALALPRIPLPALQAAEALAALRTPAPRDALADLLDAVEGEAAQGLEAALHLLATHALVWPDSEDTLHMAAPLRRAWSAPLGLDAPLAVLLKDATSDDLRRMLVALGVRPSTTKPQRLATLLEHHGDPQRLADLIGRVPADTRKTSPRPPGDRAGATASQREHSAGRPVPHGHRPGAR